jgi:hypothetical protein
MAGGEDDVAVDELSPAVREEQERRQGSRVDLLANFDFSVFQQPWGGVGLSSGHRRAGDAKDEPPESPALAAARNLAAARLAQIDAVCRLSDPQHRKLQLVMESEIRRVVAEVDSRRTKYRDAEIPGNFQDPAVQQVYKEFQKDVLRCRRLLADLFAGGSLLAKTLPTTLVPEQYSRLTAEFDARRAYRWQALVAEAMATFDELLGLDQREHEALEAVLLDRRPDLRVDRPATAPVPQYQRMVVPLVLAEAGEGQLSSIVNERQLQVLMQFARKYGQSRSMLEEQGILQGDVR